MTTTEKATQISEFRARARARTAAITALGILAGAVGWLGQQGYRTATDSFVAPLILSPESDAVLATKLHASQLEAEHAKVGAELERLDADLEAGLQAIGRLRSLEGGKETTRAWFSQLQENAASASSLELSKIKTQRGQIAEMLRAQEAVVADAERNLAGNIISRADFTREKLALSHLRLALYDAERTEIRASLDAAQARLARSALEGKGPSMPELVAREEQAARIQLEVVKLENEQRTRRTERQTLVEKLARLEELGSQLRARPLYRATQGRIEAAFVPYTQLDGVERGATVYECTWSLVMCKNVGTVAEVVGGEVVLTDPWGAPARGQYAVLDLRDHRAARAKVLRVRPMNAAARMSQPAPAGSPVTLGPR